MLRGGNRLFHLRDSVFAPFAQRLSVHKIKVDNCLLGDFQAITGKRLTLHLLWHVARIVVLAVTGQPQHRSDDQLRRTTCAHAFHCAANHIQACAEIRSIETVTFEPVADRPINQITTGKFAVVGR